MARKGGLSNETIYRQKWAMFVDNTIARRASSGGTEGVGERVELRDLMHLEEVLSKIEACSRESLGDVGASQEVRCAESLWLGTRALLWVAAVT